MYDAGVFDCETRMSVVVMVISVWWGGVGVGGMDVPSELCGFE
jgi:hypothetical protein